ncbi:DoxX family protein [Solibacillus sp. FSL H8-0538]|uniref:DoxX family protein n=1 Tax=Solibacillus sp. FSL H8-0538 TaxID=2921400 RepID=UPI0030F7E7C9
MEIMVWILQVILGAAFLMAGLGKLAGSKMHKDSFTHWRLPQWFRLVTGGVEGIAGALLIAGFWQGDWIVYGAIMTAAVGVGGVATHVRVKDPMKATIPIAVLGILGLILTYLVY